MKCIILSRALKTSSVFHFKKVYRLGFMSIWHKIKHRFPVWERVCYELQIPGLSHDSDHLLSNNIPKSWEVLKISKPKVLPLAKWRTDYMAPNNSKNTKH